MTKLVFAIAIATASVAAASQGQGDGEFDKQIARGADDPLILLQKVVICESLGLSQQQNTAIEKIVFFDSLDEKDEKRADEAKERNRKRVNDLLTPQQRSRLQEIILQFEDARALRRKDIATKLSLTDDQKSKIVEILDNTVNAQKAPVRGLSRDEMYKQALEVLTPPQREQFEKLKGEIGPFTARELNASRQRDIERNQRLVQKGR